MAFARLFPIDAIDAQDEDPTSSELSLSDCTSCGSPHGPNDFGDLPGRRRIISASAENRGNSCQRKHPAEILALGPSCAQKETIRLNTGAKGIGTSKGVRVNEKPTLASQGIDKNLAPYRPEKAEDGTMALGLDVPPMLLARADEVIE